MTTTPLVVDTALPGGTARFEVSPPELAPWTNLFWQHFPKPANVPNRRYRLEKMPAGDYRIKTPGGSQCCSRADAQPLWDQLMRNVLWRLAGPAVLHGGLVSGPSGALLILGDSGTGKSTMVRNFLADGYDYAGDEWVCVRPNGLQGLPRCLEWTDPENPPVPEPTVHWSYISPREEGPRTGYFGHITHRLVTSCIPWRNVRAAIVLQQQRTGPHFEQIQRIPDDCWLHRAGWRDFRTLLRLVKLPVVALFPGDVQETFLALKTI